MKRLILLCILLNHTFILHTQIKVNYGPEIGISINQLTSTNEIPVDYGEYTIKKRSHFNPIIGINGEFIIKKDLHFGSGLQYELTGEKRTSFRIGKYHSNDPFPEYTYTSEKLQIQRFHKICIPVYVGFSHQLWNVRPTFIIGFRHNYFLTGRYYSKSVFDASDDDRDYIREKSYNPFTLPEDTLPAKRLNIQLMVGSALHLANKIRINFSYSKGITIRHGDEEQQCGGSYYTTFNHTDIALSLQYLFSYEAPSKL